MVRREDLLAKEVEDVEVRGDMTVRELVTAMASAGGFMASHLARASEILVEMLSDPECTVMMAFTANIVATGLRGVIADFVRRGLVDLLVTTGGTVDHDVARALGGKYYHGSFSYDDVMLRELEIHRLGNVLVPVESYGPKVEDFTLRALSEAVKVKESWAVHELLYFVGRLLRDERSILRQAHLSAVPVFSPGVVDSAFGTALMLFRESQRAGGRANFVLDVISDLKAISDVVFSSERLGALIVGGGISKHHVIWWSQFKGGLDYAVYITTAVEWDGSLSGAQPREAISWGKIKPKARSVVVYGDATVILPVILAYAYGELEARGVRRARSPALADLADRLRRLVGCGP